MASETGTTVNASSWIISSTGARNQASPGLSTMVTPDGRLSPPTPSCCRWGIQTTRPTRCQRLQRQDVQVLYRFRDLDNRTEARPRLSVPRWDWRAGVSGMWMALVQPQRKRGPQFNRLPQLIADPGDRHGSYRFGVINTPEVWWLRWPVMPSCWARPTSWPWI